jgi:hypothetical protein
MYYFLYKLISSLEKKERDAKRMKGVQWDFKKNRDDLANLYLRIYNGWVSLIISVASYIVTEIAI